MSTDDNAEGEVLNRFSYRATEVSVDVTLVCGGCGETVYKLSVTGEAARQVSGEQKTQEAWDAWREHMRTAHPEHWEELQHADVVP